MAHVIDVSTIIVDADRQRKTYKAESIDTLRRSIRATGLIHPPVVEKVNGHYHLRTGERRLRAVTTLSTPYLHGTELVPPGSIPVTLWGELSDLQREEIEWEENALREDLPWPEQVAAKARLHQLRERQAAARGEKQTYLATAKELKGESTSAPDITDIRESVMLAPFLNDPDVKAAKGKIEAFNIVRKKLRNEFTAALATKIAAAPPISPHTLHHASCVDLLPHLPTAQFDVILTDPPYGINAHKMAPMSGSTSGILHSYVDTPENARVIWEAIFREGARVCKPEAHIYMFLDFKWWEEISNLAHLSGWTPWPTPLIWHKPGGGMLGDSTRGPRRSYELVFYARKGDKRVRGVYLDVIVAASADQTTHAAAKPVEVYKNLLQRSVLPGDRVLDPCCGSGTIFPAASSLSCLATGIEIDPTYHNTALKRKDEK